MANPIQPRSALARVYHLGPLGIAADVPGVTIAERRNLTLTHTDTGGDETPLTDPGHSRDAADSRAIWLGPGRALVVGTMTDVPDGTAVNDVSSSRTVLRLSGPAVRDTLAAGCTIDLDPIAFTPGMCATTDIDHVVVTLDCVEVETFDVYIPRGFAVSFWEWLIEQAQEFGGDVKPSI